MNISEEALDYLVQEPLAQELIYLLNANGDNVIGSWFTGNSQPFTRQVGVAQIGQNFQTNYSDKAAERADAVLRRLHELHVLEMNSAGRCSSPIKYALKGEWLWGPVVEGIGTVEFKPQPQDRKYLHELVH